MVSSHRVGRLLTLFPMGQMVHQYNPPTGWREAKGSTEHVLTSTHGYVQPS